MLGYSELGGAEKQSIILAIELIKLGFPVKFIVFDPPGKVNEILLTSSAEVINLPLKKSLSIRYLFIDLLRLLKSAKSTHSDIILAYTFWPNIYGSLIWRLTGARHFYWGQRDEGRGLKNMPVIKFALRLANEFISNSNQGKEILINQFNIPRKKVRIIYNGVTLNNPQFDRNTWRMKLKISNDSIAFLKVANYHQFKNHLILVNVWEKLILDFSQERIPYLIFVGKNAGTKEIVESEINKKNLQSYIKLLNFEDDISGLINACDIGIFCSNYEGIPNAILESMILKRAIITNDFNGSFEALGTQYPFIVRNNSIDEYIDHINKLINDKYLREYWGNENYKRANSLFTIQNMVNNYLELFNLK